MITTDGQTTRVTFGTPEKASIAVMANGDGLVTFQQLSTEKQVGDFIEKTDAQELPKIEIEFFKTESIDIVIEALNLLKRHYKPPVDPCQSATAC